MEKTKKRSAKRVSLAVKEKVAQAVREIVSDVKLSVRKKNVNEGQMFNLIQNKAYELYVSRGYSAGSDLGDWYEAEKLMKKELGA